MSREPRGHWSYMGQRAEVTYHKGSGLPRPRHHSRVRVSDGREKLPTQDPNPSHPSVRPGRSLEGKLRSQMSRPVPSPCTGTEFWEKPGQGSYTGWVVPNLPGLRFGGGGVFLGRRSKVMGNFRPLPGPRRRGTTYLSRG